MIQVTKFLSSPCIDALIMAGGQGLRCLPPHPKQYLMLHGKSILAWSLAPFLTSEHIRSVRVVIRKDDEDLYLQAAPDHAKLRPPVIGGEERTHSVANGLQALFQDHPPDYVLIHDAARPALSDTLLARTINHLDANCGVAPGIPVVDTLRVRGENGSYQDVERHKFLCIQTPQGFPFQALYESYQRSCQKAPVVRTDDIGIFTMAGHPVTYFPGCRLNVKLTQEDDLPYLERILQHGI